MNLKKTFNFMLLCWDLVLPAGIVYPSRHRAVIVTHVVEVIVKLFLCEGAFCVRLRFFQLILCLCQDIELRL